MKNEDVELIHHILAGDEGAFVRLVERYQKQVHALVWRKIGDFHIAEEITQDTFLKVHQKLSTLKDPNQFSGWLYVIATRQCLSWLRKKRIETESLEESENEGIDEAAYSRFVSEEHAKATTETQREVVKKLLAKLKESERTVMTLHYLGEMTIDEISRFLGVSTSAIKLRLHRARQRLQKEEPMIREALSNFQLSPNLTENIIQKVENIQPTPTSAKPFIPWVIGVSTVLLIVLMLAVGSKHLSRYQQPYSLESQSELSVELIDTPIVLNLDTKPDVRNQLGENMDNQRDSDGTGEESNQVLSDNGDYTQWRLPEKAKARLGKGGITGNGIVYSPDGKHMAVASSIGIWIYDAQTGEEQDFLWSVGSFVQWRKNNQVNLPAGEPLRIICMSFSPDGKILATGNWDHTIVLWDVDTKQQIAAFTELRNKVKNNVYTVSFSADGKILASGHGDGTVYLWNVLTRQQEAVFTGHTDPVRGLSFSPTDNKILASGDMRELRLWDVVSGQYKTIWNDVLTVNFSPDGRILASGHGDGTVQLWNVKTGKNQAVLKGHARYVTTLDFSPDGKTLISGSDKTVRQWDVKTQKQKKTIVGHTNNVNSVAYSVDGSTFASSSWNRDEVRLWCADTGIQKATLNGHTPSVNSIDYSPDGKIIATGHWDGKIRLWDVSTRKLKKTLAGHTDKIWCINFSPDGKTIASGGYDNMVRLWNVETGRQIKMTIRHTVRKGYENCVRSVVFSPDGMTLASASGLEVWLWDVSTDQLKKILDVHTDKKIFNMGHTDKEIFSLSFSPDGKTIVAGGSDKTVRIWDVDTGKQKNIISERSLHFGIKSVSFSPDGRTIAGSSFNSVRLWDVKTGKRKAILTRHDFPPIRSVSFSPDGKMLASGGSGRSVRLWDVSNKRWWNVFKKRSIATFKGHVSSVTSVSFSPDSKTLASGSDDGTILLWDLTPLTKPN